MLAITSNAAIPSVEEELASSWNGPIVLVLLPDSIIGSAQTRRLAETFFVIEYLEELGGPVATLRDLLSLLRLQVERGDWPLLFLNSPRDPDFIASQYDLGLRRAHEVDAGFEPSGELAWLRLGEMVATSPVLPDILSFIEEKGVDDTQAVELLKLSFPGDGA